MADDQQDPDAYFKDKKTVTISEVAILLDEYVGTTRQRDPEYQPNLLVSKTLEYAKAFATNKNRASVQNIRKWVPPCHLCWCSCWRSTRLHPSALLPVGLLTVPRAPLQPAGE